VKDTLIAVMAKQPLVGKTKTRLYPALSLVEAAELYQALLLDTIELASRQPWADLAVAITPPESRPYFESITPRETLLLPVEGQDIGACLAQTLDLALNLGYRKVLALNSDGPSVPPEYLEQAANDLEGADVVLGPGEDGGYYLVGLTQPHPGIFSDIAWSTEKVLSQTLERAAGLGLRTTLTPPWYDVDTPAEVLRLVKELQAISPDRLPNSRRFLGNVDLQARLE
jgi:hypothetical protein